MHKYVLLLFCFFILSGNSLYSQKVRSIKADALVKTIKESRVPLVINFWATWCKPCIEELPYFKSEIEKYPKDSLRFLLVSLDYAEAFPKTIKKKAKRLKIQFPVYWLNESNADYFCPLIDSSWSGAIPASLFINNKSGYRKLIEGQISREDLQKEINTVFKNN